MEQITDRGKRLNGNQLTQAQNIGTITTSPTLSLNVVSLLLLPERACTMVLDLQGDECWLEGPFRRGAIYAEDDISEIREICPCEVAAAPDAA